jgi:hypothetical protein
MLWYGGFVLLGAIAVGFTAQHAVLDVNGTHVGGVAAPLDMLAPVAAFLAMIFGTSAGLSLNREGETVALSWTKPVSRTLIALRIMAVDVAAILVMYAFAWLVILGVAAAAGATIVPTSTSPAMIALSIGVALMWWALIEAITAMLPSGGRSVVGFLWPAALIVGSISGLGGAIGAIILILNVVNPLAYLGHLSSSNDVSSTSTGYWHLPVDERALAVWALSVVLSAIAVVLWQRREA